MDAHNLSRLEDHPLAHWIGYGDQHWPFGDGRDAFFDSDGNRIHYHNNETIDLDVRDIRITRRPPIYAPLAPSISLLQRIPTSTGRISVARLLVAFEDMIRTKRAIPQLKKEKKELYKYTEAMESLLVYHSKEFADIKHRFSQVRVFWILHNQFSHFMNLFDSKTTN